MDKQTKRWWMIAGVMVLLACIAGGFAIWKFWPEISSWSQSAAVDDLKKRIQDLGAYGWILILAIQVLQVVIAFIPGEPVELAAGAIYGWWLGLIICIIGCIIGTWLVWMLVQRYGIALVNKMFKKDVREVKFFQDSSRIELLTFILFLLPMTPKDMLTYVAGLTRIRFSTFLWISILARIPSMLSSTLMASTAMSGDYHITIIVFAITTILGVAGILCKEKIYAISEKRKHSKDALTDNAKHTKDD